MLRTIARKRTVTAQFSYLLSGYVIAHEGYQALPSTVAHCKLSALGARRMRMVTVVITMHTGRQLRCDKKF